MVMFICDICKKEFKTNQHLHQHKNRKKACVNDNADSNIANTNNENKNINDYNINNLILEDDKMSMSSDMTINDILTFLKTYKSIQDLIKDKNEINELREENEKFRKQLEVINNIIKNETTREPSSQPTYHYCELIEKPSSKHTKKPSDKNTEKPSSEHKLVMPYKRAKIVTPT
jgi:hypothetical protein